MKLLLEYESGMMEQDETTPYYLIPTRPGVFPGFFVASSLDVAENQYLASLKAPYAGVETSIVESAELNGQIGCFQFEVRDAIWRFLSQSSKNKHR